MFITITQNELAELHTTCRAEFADVLKPFGINVEDTELREVALQGVVITDQGDRWLIEISPEIAQRQAKAFGRFARVAMPVVLALKAACSELFKELEDIQRWIGTKR